MSVNKETLIKDIVELYHTSKQIDKHNNRIKRGMQPSISSKVEDLFAQYLCNNFSDRWKYYIEYHIKLSGGGKSYLPDITVVDNLNKDRIVSFFDIKMDIGYSRDDFKDFCREQQNRMDLIKGEKVIISYSDDKFECAIHKDIQYNIVIISSANISKIKFDSLLCDLKELTNVKIYYLTYDIHPNNKQYKYDELIKKIKINVIDFDKMHKQLDFLNN